MTHGDQLRSLFGCADAGKAGHFQWIAFRIIRQLIENTAFNLHESVRHSGSFGVRFGRNIHHAGAAFFVVVREFGDFKSARMSSPAAHSNRSGSVTRNALQRARAATSPEPWDTPGSMVAPSGLSL